jgi:XTP/dITP diphosphohydrolase
MKRLLLASRNPGKCSEMRALLLPLDVDVIDVAQLETSLRVDEVGETYAENAILKAETFARQYRMLTIGDDTGLEVDALEGAPGLRSARLAGPGGTDADRREQLLSMLEPHPRPWTARFRCVVACANENGIIGLAEGTCEGEIIADARGAGGFGYDPIFLLEGLGRTMAELSPEEKNHVSHRARAIKAILPVLEENLAPDQE